MTDPDCLFCRHEGDPMNQHPNTTDNDAGRHHRNGHLMELAGCMWRCLHCRHWFDAAVDADLFWCGDDCAGKHHEDLAPGGLPADPAPVPPTHTTTTEDQP